MPQIAINEFLSQEIEAENPTPFFLSVGAINLILLLATLNSSWLVHTLLRLMSRLDDNHLNHGLQIICPCTWVKLILLCVNIAFLLFSQKKYKAPRLINPATGVKPSPGFLFWAGVSYALHFSLITFMLIAMLAEIPTASKKRAVAVQFMLATPAKKEVEKCASKRSAMTDSKNTPVPHAVPSVTSKMPLHSTAKTIPRSSQRPMPDQKSSAPPARNNAPTTAAAEDKMDSSTSPGPAPSTESAAHSEAITTNSGQGIGRPVEEGSDSNDQLSNYLSEVWKKVRKNWHPPKGMESRSCTVKFRIRRNGTIDSVSVVKSSGIEEVDEAAEDAVRSSSPLPVMPPEEGEDIDIKFSFDYNVYGSKTTKE